MATLLKRKADGDRSSRPSKRAASGANTPATQPTPSSSSDAYAGSEADSGEESDGDVEPVVRQTISDNIAKFSVSTYSGKNDKKKAKQREKSSDMTNRYFARDHSYLHLKSDHQDRPIWIDPDNARIILENFSPLARQAQDFLITIAEPMSRPQNIHEFNLSIHSLYAAVSVGLTPQDIMLNLEKFSKSRLPQSIRDFILSATGSFGKAKLVLKHNLYFVESTDANVLQMLLKDEVIGPCRAEGTEELTKEKAPTMGGLVIPGTKNASGMQHPQDSAPQAAVRRTEADAESDDDEFDGNGGLNDEELFAAIREEDDDDDDDTNRVHSFEISRQNVEKVQRRCLQLGYPITEEYDFHDDTVNANLNIDLRPAARIRDYQEQALSKMFGNGRAKSGIIVLPCGAGKTLVGITAACTIKKSVIVLCNSAMSVSQWRAEFLKWSNISPSDIAIFTADAKEKFHGSAGIIITNYSMVAKTEGRAYDSKKMMEFLTSREWGLMILDEVHVAPAAAFRKVTSSVAAHSKLGLTATLIREDDKIKDLNFLIGPKLYEANWMELAQAGHIARVQCAEVWCPMTAEFYQEYLRETSRKRTLLYTMNPRKFQACQFLIDYHEKRGDKTIVFSDNVYALQTYAKKLGKAFIFGQTSHQERQNVLENFQFNPSLNTIFLSKIGDTSLDLPEATCLIQISSHYGSRRQEAQRLGRILRAKRRNDEGFNAFFYSLVSKDTTEMFYSSKRQAFLVDQGYAFKVITHLHGMDDLPSLAFKSPQDRRELLQEVMLQNEMAADVEVVGDGYDRAAAKGHRAMAGREGPRVKRTAGQLADLAGGQDMAYVEYNRTKNSELKRGKRAKGPQSDFMKKIARENARKREAER